NTIGNYWPYATTIFDYVRRAMPFNAPGSLTDQEVYDITAYLLYLNGIIQEEYIITEKTLSAVEMPARKRYILEERQGGREIRYNNMSGDTEHFTQIMKLVRWLTRVVAVILKVTIGAVQYQHTSKQVIDPALDSKIVVAPRKL